MHTKTLKQELDTNKWRLGSFFGVFFALLGIFFIAPIFEKNFSTHLLLQCSFTLLIFSTIYAIDGQSLILYASLFLLIPFVYFDALSFQYQSLPYMITAYGFSTIFILLAIVVLMRKILQARLVNADVIFAALMVYTLAGILWGNLYFIVNLISSGSFQGAGALNFDSQAFLSTYEQQFNFLYYSFATLATLGMGDITPLNHLAKSLTAIESMFGQLFVAIFMAKLVSAWWHVPAEK